MSLLRRLVVLLGCAFALVIPARVEAQNAKAQNARKLLLRSDVLSPAVPLSESGMRVVQFRIEATVDGKGEGAGTLDLDPNARTYNEFGDVTGMTEIAHIRMECSIKFVKADKLTLSVGPGKGDSVQVVERRLYAIEGKNITSRLSLIRTGVWPFARLRIQSADGKVATIVIDLHEPPRPEPCHPGCFPAGTPVATPEGLRPIETIRAAPSS